METKGIIIKSLGITELDYCNKVMESGYGWIRIRSGNNEEQLVNNIAKIPLFWKWWNNQWIIRDKEFVRQTSIDIINEALEGKVRRVANEIYNDIHNPYHLIAIPNVWLQAEINNLILQEIAKEEEQIKQLQK
jgi:hypothetical protein